MFVAEKVLLLLVISLTAEVGGRCWSPLVETDTWGGGGGGGGGGEKKR